MRVTVNNLTAKSIAASRRRIKPWQRVEPYIYIVPAVFFAVLFGYYPLIRTLQFSVSLVNMQQKIVEFVGFENFQILFADKQFIQALKNNLLFVVMYMPACLILSFSLALLASKRRPLSKAYQTLFSLPMAVSVSSTSLIFKCLMDPNIGMINRIFRLGQLDWINNTGTVLIALTILSVWSGCGFDFLLFLAAIRNIPSDLMENADLCGANPLQKLRYVIMPLVSPTMFYVICTQTINAMMFFQPVKILTEGGPKGASRTMVYYIYLKAFGNNNYSLAGAACMIAFILTFALMLINFIYERKGVVYD